MVLSIIEKHKGSQTAQESVDPRQLTDIIHDIFFASEKAGLFIDNKTFQLNTAISILTNFIWNIFDPKRMHNISMMELKLTFLIICEMEPVNSYKSIMDMHFEIVKDFNRCITKTRFEEFINIFAKILSYLGEPIYFEPKVIADILIESFKNVPGSCGISQDSFYNLWLSHQDSKFSSYTNIFLLLIRFKKSEAVIHQNDCAGCKKFPIVGLRYKCQKCKISLCFDCFSKGFTSARHSLGHRFFELSTCERDRQGVICTFIDKFLSIFQKRDNATLNPNLDLGNTKLIEDDHIELMQVDDDMDVGTFRKRRGTIRSEVYNNSENLFIQQRDLIDKLLSATENLKLEGEKFNNIIFKFVDESTNSEMQKEMRSHGEALSEQIEIFQKIHEDLANTFGRNQSNNTIRPFSSPTKSIFLPSSTPMTKENSKPVMLNKSSNIIFSLFFVLLNLFNVFFSVNGYEINKSHVNDNAEYSISDLSTFFMAKLPNNAQFKMKMMRSKSLDDTDAELENFKELLQKFKELSDGSL